MKHTLALLFVVFSVCTQAQPPAGYYNNAAGKTCADLKNALNTIINTGYNAQSYGDLWTQYKLTDIKPREVGSGSANVIYDIYSDNPTGIDPYNFTPVTDQCGSYSGEGSCYNREHSVPQSWFNSATTPSSDYVFIFPTDGYVNNRRSNYPYGEVAAPTWQSQNGSKLGASAVAGITGTVFEPIDSFKGDVARAFLYFVTKYQSSMSTWAGNADAAQAFEPNTFPSVDVPYLRMMIRWHHLDPVSQKELTRNNGAYSFQHNRNPYIDHPEYVDSVWNSLCAGLSALPVSIVYFKGQISDDKVKLTWETANEINVDRYEVERSFNGTSYSKIGEVRAANAHTYNFTDNSDDNKGRRVYYRLKKLDKDGRFSYSEVLSLHISLHTAFTVYPNPASSYLQLLLNNNMSGDVQITLTDATGRVVKQQTTHIANGSGKISIADIGAGNYVLKLNYNGGQYSQKVVVVK